MSPPIWLLDPIFMDKKVSKSNQLRNFSSGINKKNDNVHTISDLLAEMQDILCDNAKLQSENTLLKKETNALRNRNEALLKDMEENRAKFDDDLNQIQNNIKMNEAHLIDNSKKCLQQQKKQIEEIVQLKSENEQLRLEISKTKTEKETLKKIEDETKALQLSYNTIKSQNEENAQKSNRYKNKLKYAITIINDLNSMLIQYTKKPVSNTVETQTEDQLHFQEIPVNQTYAFSPQNANLETENLLLSEIFFRSKSFCDNELLFINENDSSHNLEN
ncbi:golgin IMH1-like [Anoplophora glabripennis]|uniref:golgin IMH1-like n=1 Tax=Anoplophora glabripennis TaxID=217634 RepID=UPI000873B4B8|nr:golgin IMH1-like [Anoplophora glabripennis]